MIKFKLTGSAPIRFYAGTYFGMHFLSFSWILALNHSYVDHRDPPTHAAYEKQKRTRKQMKVKIMQHAKDVLECMYLNQDHPSVRRVKKRLKLKGSDRSVSSVAMGQTILTLTCYKPGA